ncbi:MAG: PaaI family thioesterase [Brevundimonas sp.]|jgi:uncharacterized protein (TIGR00369 family)|uniref:PaaI family thioesterase n=1 Tax=Brevundimonas sp. TaxID=1871086 RepID=UPI002AB8B825|nr:PaaI family thioesterase [Brevundimonas sp.]MDZ4110140.1 PaaI family thioesterase [Brevundimonas sp.]
MSRVIEAMPYARFLGLTAEQAGDILTVTMPFSDHLIGNPMLPALHGGSTAALLEITAMAQVAESFPGMHLPRPINVSVAYLRSGRAQHVYARARINKAGRRVAHVLAEAWQEDEAQPIAALTAHFLLEDSF